MPEPTSQADSTPPYEPPRVVRLGTLTELTAGGVVTPSPADGFGYAGLIGYLG